jgi:hypothetical protein
MPSVIVIPIKIAIGKIHLCVQYLARRFGWITLTALSWNKLILRYGTLLQINDKSDRTVCMKFICRLDQVPLRWEPRTILKVPICWGDHVKVWSSPHKPLLWSIFVRWWPMNERAWKHNTDDMLWGLYRKAGKIAKRECHNSESYIKMADVAWGKTSL